MAKLEVVTQDKLQSAYFEQLISASVHCVSQCEQLLQLVSKSDFTRTVQDGSSVGAHMRHILDRFYCFFSGLEKGCIDFDDRQRNRELEANIDYSEAALVRVSAQFSALTSLQIMTDPILIKEAVCEHGDSVTLASTVDRELMGLISHSTHHLAIIALILKSLGYEMDKDLGKAPSTILHERSQ
ncbi:MAG: hypothetical protein COC19_04435 [SAR86 cluster bacterium]|uniref:DinB-like domain-containing protein n=1 Tax=SAR86 cluster bacterium TaxID=2030880 RepID=A0A2A4MNT7_9GAMM|nr:MAG: hypothetical protein COC19_04435 [SAR86 cluster bacterium]